MVEKAVILGYPMTMVGLKRVWMKRLKFVDDDLLTEIHLISATPIDSTYSTFYKK